MDEVIELVKKHWPPKYIVNAYSEFIPGETPVYYSGPTWDENEVARAIESLLKGLWLSSGEEVAKFESYYSKKINVKKSVMCNSGSSANLLMVSALKSKRKFNFQNISIATPVAGFPTTVNPIIQNNFNPVFIDIELETLNIDLELLEKELIKNKNIKALMFAHVLGIPPDLDKINDLCEKYNILFLEDNCDALGGKWKGKPLGSFGVMSSCSFYPAHHITSGEGGIVSTNDLVLADIVRSLCWWGRGCYCIGRNNLLPQGTCGKRFSKWIPDLNIELDHKYVFEEIGYNFKPMDFQGAILQEQLKKLDKETVTRQRNYYMYKAFFNKYKDLFVDHKIDSRAEPSPFGFPVTLKEGINFTKIELVKFLESKKIQTRNYFAGNILNHPAYYNYYNGNSLNGIKANDFPNANNITFNTFFLGVSSLITIEQINYVIECFKEFLEGRR